MFDVFQEQQGSQQVEQGEGVGDEATKDVQARVII